MPWSKVHEWDTVLSADSVEWCPIDPFKLYFVCGTYFLLDNQNSAPTSMQIQERKGSIALFEVTKSELKPIHELNTYGILDCKWNDYKIGNDVVLAISNAIGDVSVLQLVNCQLETVCTLNLKTEEKGDYIALSVKWFKESCNSDEGHLCATDNKGNAVVLKYDNRELTLIEKWQAHSLEAWTIAFDALDRQILYTGGDDAKLRVWDTRAPPACKLHELKRQDTGVTIIETDTPKEHQIVSGSFDERILFWDTRQWKTPQWNITTSGGPWRAKFLDKHLLTANIYGGYQIFDCFNEPVVVGDYKEHESLAYGADWCRLSSSSVAEIFGGSSGVKLIGTCSFYDHRLTISLWDPEK